MVHKCTIIFHSAILFITSIQGSNVIEKDLSPLFRGSAGTLVIYDQTGAGMSDTWKKAKTFISSHLI